MRVLAWLLSLLASPMQALAGPGVAIELLPQVQAVRDTLSLGQVAYLRSTDLETMRLLVDLPVARAPRLGESAVVSRTALAAVIARRAGILPDSIVWSGAAQVRVQRPVRIVRGEDLVAAAAGALRSALAQQGVGKPVSAALLPRDLELPLGEVRLQPRPIGPAAARGHVVVWLDVLAGDAWMRTVAVPFRVESDSVPAVAGPLQQRGAAMAGSAAPPPAAVAPATPDVARGEWAVMHASAGMVALESRVEVLQDGRVGDKVRVRQNGATGVVFARVRSRGIVELAP